MKAIGAPVLTGSSSITLFLIRSSGGGKSMSSLFLPPILPSRICYFMAILNFSVMFWFMSPSDLGESLDRDDARPSWEPLSSTFVLFRSRLCSPLSYFTAAELKRCGLCVPCLIPSFNCEVFELLLLAARISSSLTTGTYLEAGLADNSVYIS